MPPNETESAIRIMEIRDAGQLKIIEDPAWKIFPPTFADLIPESQIPYMMHRMYDGPVLSRMIPSCTTI